MAGKRTDKRKQTEEAGERLRSLRLIAPVRRLLEQIHLAGTERDRAGNRKFFYDEFFVLLLLYFCNPSLDSQRALQNATGWSKVRRKLGISRVSAGSLSEAAQVFDPALVRPILRELLPLARPHFKGREREALANLTAVDGSVFTALGRIAWNLWQEASHRTDAGREAKLHLQFCVAKSVVSDAVVTPPASEPATLAGMLQPGLLYVCDRGYASFDLFRKILDAGSSFIIRVKDDIALHVQEEREVPPEARAKGVVRDVVLRRLGTDKHKDVVGRSVRLVIVRTIGRDGKASELWLVTDRLDMPADLVAVAYRHRWTVELFFRWLKCVLGSRHLLFHKENGVTLQLYAAIIVSLLIAIRTGSKPTKRTLETIQNYFLGWVSEEDFAEHLARLKKSDA